jgi:serine/threonine-protein kinase
MNLPDLFAELKRRRVIKVAGIYVIAMFATLQGVQVLAESLSLPAWTMTMLTLIVLVAFPIVIVVAWVFDVTPAGVQRAAPSSVRQAPLYVGLGIVIALVGFGAYSVFDSEKPTETEAAAGNAATTSIVVLPFVNMSADKEQEYFSDGLTEELLNALAQVPELRVAARTSSFAFKGKNVPVAEIARTLNVTSVLEGSVRKAGNRVRITAQLIDAAGGHHLWSQTYDRELNDIFAIQEEISRSITDALKIKLGARTSDALAAHATDNLDAYNLYLQARHFWNKRSADGLRRARELMERAIELDPEFARAHAALADVYIIGAEYADVDFPRVDSHERAEGAALRAIALDSTLAEPHASLGSLAERRLEWDKSLAEHQRAIALNPNYASAHQWYAWALLYTGKVDEALREIQKALELDPLSQIFRLNLGEFLVYLRRYDEARAQFEKLIELDPTFTMGYNDLAWVYGLQGNHVKATEYAERVLAMPGNRTGYELATPAWVFARAGQPERARKLIAELEARRLFGMVAYSYLGLGENDKALSAFEKAVELRDPAAAQLALNDPAFDSIRQHPRYQAMLRKIGLE